VDFFARSLGVTMPCVRLALALSRYHPILVFHRSLITFRSMSGFHPWRGIRRALPPGKKPVFHSESP